MGFFEDLGRKVEEFKQTATDAAAEEASHECRNCGERFFVDHDECPECDAPAVVSRVAPDSSTSASSESVDGSDDSAVESAADDSSASTESESRDGSTESESRDGSTESESRDGSTESESLD